MVIVRVCDMCRVCLFIINIIIMYICFNAVLLKLAVLRCAWSSCSEAVGCNASAVPTPLTLCLIPETTLLSSAGVREKQKMKSSIGVAMMRELACSPFPAMRMHQVAFDFFFFVAVIICNGAHCLELQCKEQRRGRTLITCKRA